MSVDNDWQPDRSSFVFCLNRSESAGFIEYFNVNVNVNNNSRFV